MIQLLYMTEPFVFHCAMTNCHQGLLFSEAFTPGGVLETTAEHLAHGDSVHFRIQHGLSPIGKPEEARVIEEHRVFLSD